MPRFWTETRENTEITLDGARRDGLERVVQVNHVHAEILEAGFDEFRHADELRVQAFVECDSKVAGRNVEIDAQWSGCIGLFGEPDNVFVVKGQLHMLLSNDEAGRNPFIRNVSAWGIDVGFRMSKHILEVEVASEQ